MAWVDVKERLPDVEDGKYRVKNNWEEEAICLFYADGMGWIQRYGYRPCNWWDVKAPHLARRDVTHWFEDFI